MRKMMSLCAIVVVFFAMNNIAVGTADAQTETLRSWSRKINNARERFEVLHQFNDEAVLDRETQLVWERAPQDPFLPGTFSVAVADCYARIAGGRMGWRLPTVEELTSLLVETPTSNPQVIRAALPPGHPFIGIRSGDRPGSAYWSITAGSNSFGNGRFTVAVNEPEVSTVVLETNLEVVHPNWCVRGPGGGQSSREP
jgi:Protein of unknown function (DUF1566)